MDRLEARTTTNTNRYRSYPADRDPARSVAAVLCALLIAVTLSACGGGGGNSGASVPPPPPPPPPPMLSNNADLMTLTLDGVTLDPAFDAAVTDYTAAVGFLTSVIVVDGAPEDSAATITVNGSPLGAGGTAIDLGPGINGVSLEVTAEDGTTIRRYTVEVVRQPANSFAQDAYLKASNAEALDNFGEALAFEGDTLVVGADKESGNGINGPGDNSLGESGAVYVFTRDAVGIWREQAYLKASNAGSDDSFGKAVALSGDTLVVGAPLEDGDGVGGAGDNSASAAGAAYVFTRDGAGVWSEEQYLKASNADAGDTFGLRVTLAGDTLAISAPGEDGNGVAGETNNDASRAGAVYVFTRDSAGVWSQQQYLKASNAEAGDIFGGAVALSGDSLAVGAPSEDSNGVSGEMDNSALVSGAVYVFTRDSAGDWVQQAYLKASNAEAGDTFGLSVALAGDTLVTGAIGEDGNGVDGEMDNSENDSGAAYVFTRDATGAWSQQDYLKASNAQGGDFFGASVASSGDMLAVGASGEDGNGVGGESNNEADRAGAAYLFTRDGAGVWMQQAYLKASNAGASDRFGNAVAISGDTLATTAFLEAGNGIDGDQNDSAVGAGAVYTFGGIPSRSAELSSIGLKGFELDQIFQPSQSDYTAGVDFLVRSLPLDLDADVPFTVMINGVPTHPDEIRLALDEGANAFDIEIVAEDGVTIFAYSLTVTRQLAGSFAQRAYLKASNVDAGDAFGARVALSGDTLAVAAFFESSNGADGETDNSENEAGAVYVFTRDSAGVWTQQAYLKASNAQANDVFGGSLALSGDTLAVGAPGEDGDGVNGQTDDSQSAAGAVYVFTRDGIGQWSQQAYLKASNADANDRFGNSVALSDDTLAVAAFGEDGNAQSDGTNNSASDAGAVYVFTRTGSGNWTQQAYLKASNAGADDLFGDAVALSGETLTVGAPQEDGNGVSGELDDSEPNAGAVYVFKHIGTGWVQQDYLKASNAQADDSFGTSVALSGDTLAVGADREDGDGANGEMDNSQESAGAAYVFTRDNAGGWTQQAYLKASNAQADDRFGQSLALAGDTLVVGGFREDGDGVSGEPNDSEPNAGAAYVFTRDGADIWTQQAYLKASNAQANDLFGISMGLSRDTLAVGANFEDGNGASGETDDSAINAGAVYVWQ